MRIPFFCVFFALIITAQASESTREEIKKKLSDLVVIQMNFLKGTNQDIDAKCLSDAVENGLKWMDFMRDHPKVVIGSAVSFGLLSGISMIYGGYRIIKITKKKIIKARKNHNK